MDDERRWNETMRLWQAIKRDYFAAVEFVSGRLDPDGSSQRRLERLDRNWIALCAHDLGFATAMWHGFQSLASGFARIDDPAGPAAEELRQLDEIVGVAGFARQAYPDVEVRTVGELLALGDQAIAESVERDIGDPPTA